MDSVVRVFQIVQIVIAITGLVWALVGVVEFFGGRNHNDSMRQEKGTNSMVNGAALGVISAGIIQAIIALLNSISGV